MSELGEIRHGKEIGKNPRQWYIYHACIVCGKERWAILQRGKPYSQMCHRCATAKAGEEQRKTTLKRLGHTRKGTPDNPEAGDIRWGHEIGKSGTSREIKYIWVLCPDCGKYHWAIMKSSEQKEGVCSKCNMRRGNKEKLPKGREHPNWKGIRYCTKGGYTKVWVAPDDPFRPMANSAGWVPEHRIVMARHLGRCLSEDETVHHINGRKDDNRIENLELTTTKTHRQKYADAYNLGYRQGYNDGVREKQRELRKEIRLLRWQVKELQQQMQGKLINLESLNENE